MKSNHFCLCGLHFKWCCPLRPPPPPQPKPEKDFCLLVKCLLSFTLAVPVLWWFWEQSVDFTVYKFKFTFCVSSPPLVFPQALPPSLPPFPLPTLPHYYLFCLATNAMLLFTLQLNALTHATWHALTLAPYSLRFNSLLFWVLYI